MEGEVTNRDNDVVAIELPAPKGWKKRFTPKKGGTPKRNEIIFISPTGEEIKTKKHLDQYVKSHPEGPSASEFDWGTGDTPRRSARLSEKPKAEETPETEMPKKKQRRSSSSKAKGKKEDDDVQATEETKETVAEETKETTEVATDGGEVVTKETPAEDIEDKAEEDAKQKAHEGGGVTEKVVDEKNIGKEENVATDAMEEDNTEKKSVPTIVVEENNKEAEKESSEPEAPLIVTNKEEEIVKDVATPALEIGAEDQKKVTGENAEAVPPKPAGGGGEYQSGNYEPKTSQVSC
ncbi:hypothetical protein LguiA_012550 [Lonicera macranthoides]